MKENIKQKIKFLRRHWFWIALACFAVWAIFIDEHCLVKYWSYRRQEAAIQKQIDSYRDSIFQYEKGIEELSGDNSRLEKFAREKLMMKKTNEDVYLFDE
jgi:cell division protein FtsB